MEHVNIYITHTFKPGMTREGVIRYDIVLDKDGEESNSVGDTVQMTGTINECVLNAIITALNRMKKPVFVNVYMDVTFISNMFYGQLDSWKAAGFEKEIAQKEQWKKISEEKDKHRLNMIYAIKHPFTEWQKNEISKMDNISQ